MVTGSRSLFLSTIKWSTLMLWRQPGHWLTVVFLLALGSAGLQFLTQWRWQLQHQLQESGRYLLGADLGVLARRPLTAEENKSLEQFHRELEGKTYQLRREASLLGVLSLPASQRAKELYPMVNWRFVEPGYPFYSLMALSSGAKVADLVSTGQWPQRGCLYVFRDQATQWGAAVGQEVQAFGRQWKLCELIESDTGRSARFLSLFPTVYAHYQDLQAFESQLGTSSLQRGIFYRFSDGAKGPALKQRLEQLLTDPATKIQLPSDSAQQQGQWWRSVSDFLGLIALCSLVLAFLGLLTQEVSFWERFRSDAHILRWQMPSAHWFGLLLWQKLLLSLATVAVSTLLSAALAKAMIIFYPQLPSQFFESLGPQGLAPLLIQWLALSSLLCLVLCYAYPESLKRRGKPRSKGKLKFVLLPLFTFLPFLLLGWTLTSSWSWTAAVLAALSVLGLLLYGLFYGGLWLLRQYYRLPRLLPFNDWGREVLALWCHRPFFYLMMVLALGSALLIQLLILALGPTLEQQLTPKERGVALFAMDLTAKDLKAFEVSAKQQQFEIAGLSPLYRGRLLSINEVSLERTMEQKGDQLKLLTREQQEEQEFKKRSVNVTERAGLGPDEALVAGVPLPQKVSPSQGPIPLSLEWRYAKRLKIKLGDVLSFELQGQQFRGKVMNFRRVQWTSFRPNFFIVFPKGVLQGLTPTYLAALSFKGDKMANGKGELLKQFPQIGLFDVRQLVVVALEQIDLLLSLLQLLVVGVLLLCSFLWMLIAWQRLTLGRREWHLKGQLGLSPRGQWMRLLQELLLPTLFILLLVPLLSYGLSWWLAREFLDGFLLWSWSKVVIWEFLSLLSLGIVLTLLSWWSLAPVRGRFRAP